MTAFRPGPQAAAPVLASLDTPSDVRADAPRRTVIVGARGRMGAMFRRRARSVGVPITKYKLMAFVTSAVFAGIAGVLYSLNYSSLVAKKFDYNTSILILVFVVLGGIGNLRGSVIAAAVLTVLPEMLRSMNDYRMLIYAIVLIVVMIFNQSPQMVTLRNKLTSRFRNKNGAEKSKQKKGVA